MKKVIILILLILLSVLVFSADATSNGSDLNGISDSSQTCDAREFVGINCEDFKANRTELASAYNGYVEWCNNSQLTQITLDEFANPFLACVKVSNSGMPQKPTEGCDPNSLMGTLFVENPDDKVGIQFVKLHSAYSAECDRLGKNYLPQEAFRNFLVEQKIIRGVRFEKNDVGERVFGLAISSSYPPTSKTSLDANVSFLGAVAGIFSNTTFLIILAIGILILIVIVIIVSFFLLKKKQNDIIKEMQAVKEKMIALERTYLKGKLDESTYRKLMQQYQLRFTELELEIARLKKKQEKITKEQKEESD